MWKVSRSFMAAAVAAAGLVIVYTPVSAQPELCDSVSGGGFVVTNPGAAANFGAHGGCKNGAFWGHVNYVDHGVLETPYHVSSLEITGYLEIAPNVRDICGIAQTNADEDPVYFRVRLVGDGESEAVEAFGIRLSNGYLVTVRPLGEGGPGGGFIQFHNPNASNTAPEPALGEATMCHGLSAPVGGGGPD